MSRGLICVSIAVKDEATVQAAVAPVLPLIDVIEIRLDCMEDSHVAGFIASSVKPVLVTNRPHWEGGQCQHSEQERADLLCRALQWGASYVDIELLAAPEIRTQILAQAASVGAKVIVSSHDFQATPSRVILEDRFAQMMATGADIAKIVVTAHTPADSLRILSLQEKAMVANFPLSGFAMGGAGAISRLATLYLGGFMTYAALSPEEATAPGQLSVQELHAMLPILERTYD
ncbi:MAG: type I 3-dehydroquinate dehydratase [Desulfobulbus sp.]|nr:type I 3-dehydroquinate dehydratase [Desulfobulbus sp.]